MDVKDWLERNTIYIVKAGSHAYGMATSESDHDFRGITIPPLNYHFGLEKFEQAEKKETLDYYKHPGKLEWPKDSEIVIWSLQKFATLAANGNPNMLELLFTDPSDYILTSDYMDKLLSIRDAFVSKVLKYRFSGYAMQQLKRMRNHYRWTNDPPKQPTREDYGIENISIPKDQLHACDKLIEFQVDQWLVDQTELSEDIKIQLGAQTIRMVNAILEQVQVEVKIDKIKDILERAANRHLGFDSDFLHFLNQYKAYRGAKAEWQHYQEWLKNRNPKRAELEKKIGFDGKHASHLVRLMRMAREILEGKGVQVKRPDAEELLAIRNGAWSYDEIISWAENEDHALEEVMKDSALPKNPNRRLISDTVTEITERFLEAPWCLPEPLWRLR
jgi:uncharacterized protein